MTASLRTAFFLLVPLASLWWHSAQHAVAALALAAWMGVYRQKQPRALRKLWLYVGVLPFALWWFLAPSGPTHHGVPLLLFYLTGWYLLALAMAQTATLGRGGHVHFVWWNGGAALLLSGMKPSPFFYGAALVYALLLLALFRTDRTPHRRLWLSVGLLFACTAALVYSGLWIRQNLRGGGDFSNARQMRGFSPISFLGSFSEEYGSPYEGQVVLRVFSREAPSYLRGAVYSSYRSGHWRLDEKLRWLRPSAQKVEFSVFGDSSKGLPAWIVPSSSTFGFLLVPFGTSAVALAADSLGVSEGGALQAPAEAERRGWYVWSGGGSPLPESAPPERWLEVPARMQETLVRANHLAGLDTMASLPGTVLNLLSWFSHEFRYSAKPPPPGHREPLEVFMDSRRGYCEYFASLATLMLRTQGIPARYVTGFAGPGKAGKDSWNFRRRNAHAWVEYYAAGRWHLLDPTPPGAFPPDKPPGSLAKALEDFQSQLALVLHELRDGSWKLALENTQNRIQKVLASRNTYALLALLAILLWSLRHYRRRLLRGRPEDWRSLQWAKKLERAERKLASYGLVRERSETVGHFLTRLGKYEKSGAALVLRQYQMERFRAEGEPTGGTAIADRKL